MHLTGTRIAVVGLAVVAAATLLMVLPRGPWVWGVSAALFFAAAVVVWLAPRSVARLDESERIETLTLSRRAELVRGTSLRLREMRYRYSVRHDERGRMPFSTRINQIRLGFVPVIITDNDTDDQGLGFVAFIHDGSRWRGPGLPCAGNREDALGHAARQIDPLREIEDTGDTNFAGESGDDSSVDDDEQRWDTGSGWDDDSEPGDGGART